MSEQTFPVDSNGKELRSDRKKIVAPLAESDELCVVWIVDPTTGQQTYLYIDPTTALQCDRLAHEMRKVAGREKFIMQRAKDWGYDKFCRETVEAGYAMWPENGHLSLKLLELGIVGGVVDAAYEASIAAPAAPVAVQPPFSDPSPMPTEAQVAAVTGPLPEIGSTYAEPTQISPDGQWQWDYASGQWVPYVAPVVAPPAPPSPPAPEAQVLQFPTPPPVPVPDPNLAVPPPQPQPVPVPSSAPQTLPAAPSMPVAAPGLPAAPPPPPAPVAAPEMPVAPAPMPPVAPAPPMAAPQPPPLPGFPS